MIKINKFIIFIFLILFIIILGEIVFLMFPNSSQTQLRPLPPVASDTKPSTQENRICYSPASTSSAVLNQASLERLKRLTKDGLLSSIVINQYQGKIIELDTKGGLIKLNKLTYPDSKQESYEYMFKITITKDAQNDKFLINWPTNLKNRVKIVEKLNKQERPISINDLKINDDIIVIETTDLTNKSCVRQECTKELKIMKL